MLRLLTALAALPAALLVALAAATIAGLAVHREAGGVSLALATASMLLLPIVGLSHLLPRRGGLILAALCWPLMLLSGIPIFFPGEREAAINTGLTMMLMPLDLPVSVEERLALTTTVERLLPDPRSRAPAPVAELEIPTLQVAATEPAPSPMYESGPDQVFLPYEGANHSLVVPVTLEGPAGELLEVEMLLDTGASYTSLNASTLAALGIPVPADAPIITYRTASGEGQSPIARVQRLWLGGFDASGVTVAVCEPCASDNRVGLLGLNVTSRFLITVDSARREIVLTPRSSHEPTTMDVKPWITLRGRSTTWPDGRSEVRVSVRNKAPYPLKDVVAAVTCPERTFYAPVGVIDPMGLGEAAATIPAGTPCSEMTLDLARANW